MTLELKGDLVSSIVRARLQLLEHECPQEFVAGIVVHFESLVHIDDQSADATLVNATERATLLQIDGHVQRALVVGHELVVVSFALEIDVTTFAGGIADQGERDTVLAFVQRGVLRNGLHENLDERIDLGAAHQIVWR